MYYSSKIVVDKEPPVTTHAFQAVAKPLPPEATEEQHKQQQELVAKIKYLGSVDEVHYHFVPDELELVDQPPKAEVTKLQTLPSQIEDSLTLNGEYAQQVRYATSLTNLQRPYDVYLERNLVNVWMAIEDITSILSDVAEQVAIATVEVDGDDRTLGTPKFNPALERLKKLKKQSQIVKDELAKVGLGA